MKTLLLKLFALTAFVCLVFSSCSQNDSQKEITTIEMWYGPTYGEAGPVPSDWFGYDLIKEKLGINLVLTSLPTDSKSQTERIIQAGNQNKLPDIFCTTGDALTDLMKKDLVAPVEVLYDLMPVRTAHMYDEYSRKVFSAGGHSYALAQPGSISRNEGILIRKDWLDKLNLSVPVTLDDYLEVMRAFTLRDPDGNGKNDTFGYGAYIEVRREEEGLGRKFQPFFGAFGVEGTYSLQKKAEDTVIDGGNGLMMSIAADPNVGPGLTVYKAPYYDALSFVRLMVSEKLIDPNWIAYSKDDFRRAWKSGRFGIMREQNAAFALEANYTPFDNNFPEGQWIVIDPPKGPEGYSSVGPYTEAGHRLYAVSKKAQDEKKLGAIARLLEWMSCEEGYHSLGYGRKNINYTIDSKGLISTEGLKDSNLAYSKSSQLPYLQLRNLVFYNSEEELTLRYPAWKTKNGKVLNAYEVLLDMRERPWTDARGSENLPKPSNELKKYWETGVLDFVSGRRSLTMQSWQNWLEGFDSLGGRKWEQECYDYAVSKDLFK